MTKVLHVVWIDDEPDRREAAENLAGRLPAKVQFIDVKGKAISAEWVNCYQVYLRLIS